MQTPRFSASEIVERLQAQKDPHFANYLAMYSSPLGGIITEPAFMQIPVDDHLVHRGDGVFEAIKVVNGGVYLLDEHLERLALSASKISLKVPWALSELKNIILETSREGCRQLCVRENAKPSDVAATIRLFISRGPGSFGPSPYDTTGTQIYCIITRAVKMPEQKYTHGVSIGKSAIPVKPSWYPTVKSCNYLPNVLMKKEAVDRRLDFTVAYTEDGFLAESATENIFILDRQGQLKHPRLDYILKGTMLTRLFELVKAQGKIPVVGAADITESELLTAKGIFMVGTTMDVVPVTEYEGKKYGVARDFSLFLDLLRNDQLPNSKKFQTCS